MGKRIQRFTLPVGSEEETSPDSSTVGPLEKGAHDFLPQLARLTLP